MEVIYHPKFTKSDYAANPAADKGRIRSIMEELKGDSKLEFSKPKSAKSKDIKKVHSPDHIGSIKQRSKKLYQMASLAAGGAIESGELAYEGEPTFAVIRPPGHHASPDSCWGFCYFNNMAIAIENLRAVGKVDAAFIMDFDLHTGDGNINCLGDDPGITIMNPRSRKREGYLEEVESRLEREKEYDILGVSAGFDEHVKDWGGKLKTEDYLRLGRKLKEFSEEKCQGRRFALLEGGYNHNVLGKNVEAFIDGFKD
ncbi:MAG: histone deacetylase family protein [Candidatus Thermoplasmatota archaeon]